MLPRMRQERELVSELSFGSVMVQRLGSGRAAAGPIRLDHGVGVRGREGQHSLVSFVNVQGFRAEMRLERQNGRFIVSEMHVTPDGKVPRGGVTSRLLRYIPVHAHVEKLEAMLMTDSGRSQLEGLVIGTGVEEMFKAAPPTPRSDTSPVRGRRPVAAETLLDVAVAYTRAMKAGSRQPTLDTAKALGMPMVRVRDYVHRARRSGLLTKVVQGRPGGELTPRAKGLVTRQRRARASRPPRRKRR
jgi:hypothetical protein